MLYGLVFVQSNFNGTCSACLCVVSDCMNWLTQYISFNGELSFKKKKIINYLVARGQWHVVTLALTQVLFVLSPLVRLLAEVVCIRKKKKKLQSDHIKIKPMLQEPSWMFWTLEALSQYWSLELKIQILPFAVTWMDLEITILNEVSQKKKDKYHMISLTGGIWNMTQMNLPMK